MQKNELKNIQKTLERIVEFWFLGEPIFFACYCTHELVMNLKLTVPFRTGKMKIEYSPILLSGMEEKNIRKLFEREIIRILLKHPYLRKPEPFDAVVAIMASDITIYQDERQEIEKLEGLMEEHELPRDRSFEEYYRLLMEAEIEKPYLVKNKIEELYALNANYNAFTRQISQTTDSGLEGQDKKNGNYEGEPDCDEEGAPGKENSDSSDISEEMLLNNPNGPTGLWGDDEVARELLNEMIREKLESISDWGSLGAKLKEKIIASLTAKINYRKVLKNFRASIIADDKNLSRFRPSRRSGFEFMGSRRNFTTRILLAVDTSGSLGNPDLQNFLGVVNKFFKYGIKQIDLVYFDENLKGEPGVIRKKQKEFVVTGRGGTNFQCVFDYAKKHGEYDGVIIFTDGEGAHPIKQKLTKAKFMWVCPSQKAWNNHHEWMDKTGRSCFLTI